MANQTYSPWGYNQTPKIILAILIITVIASVCSAALEPLFINIFKINGPQEFFGLSRWGLSNFYLWQPITCLFLQSEVTGIHFSFLIALTFNMYMLWLFGSNLVEAYGSKSFLGLYFGSGVIASLAALMMTPPAQPFFIIAGAGPALLASFVAWAILHRDTQLLLFFIIAVKARWLLTAVIALTILIPLSELNLLNFVYYFTGILVGYLFSTVIFGAASPYIFMEKTDDFFIVLGRKIRAKITRLFSKEKAKSKIVDINTGNSVADDDAFIDEMLSKISKYGEKSLTWPERDRMKKISEKKMSQK
jgi:membrane associated rhomboid family serine protease